jgi:hypothetical protein
VRAVGGDHRHHVALDDLVRALLDELVLDQQVRQPEALGEAVRVVAQGVDVGLEVDVGLGAFLMWPSGSMSIGCR